MNKDKFVSDIKTQLDKRQQHLDTDLEIKTRLRQARLNALEKAETQSSTWKVPAMGLAAGLVLSALILLLTQSQIEGDFDMAGLPAEDIEILSTLEVEELENIDFYYWLEIQDDAA